MVKKQKQARKTPTNSTKARPVQAFFNRPNTLQNKKSERHTTGVPTRNLFPTVKPTTMQGNLFYETTMLSPQQKEKAINTAIGQTEKVLKVFKLYDRAFTPYEILEILEQMGHKMLITSVRRSISCLTIDRHLIKLAEQKKERHGTSNSTWTLRK